MFQFVKMFKMTEVYHFHDMIDMLIECGYKKGTTLFGYGYDFRQSNRYARSRFLFLVDSYMQLIYVFLVDLFRISVALMPIILNKPKQN